MRLMRTSGLAGFAMLAAMTFAGVGTAHADSLCFEDPGIKGECIDELRWRGPIIGLSTESVFLTSLGDVTCKSEFLADYVENEGAQIGILYLVLDFSFSNCKEFCTVAKVENLPYLLLVDAIEEHAVLTEDGKGRPAILFENCGALKLNCLYETEKEALLDYLLEWEEAVPLVGAFDPTKLPLPKGGDSQLCPNEAKWDATYLIYADGEKKEGAELFLTALP